MAYGRQKRLTVELTGNEGGVVDNDIEERLVKEEREDFILDKINHSETELNTPYYRLLTKAIIQTGNISKVSRDIGIPRVSIYKSLQRLKKFIENGN